MRLICMDTFRSKHFEPGQPICESPLIESLQARNLLFFRGYNNFSANLVRHIEALAEIDDPANAFHGKTCFHRPGLIVEPAVKNAAVITGLMETRLAFLLEKDHLCARKSLQKLIRCRKSHDSATHDPDFHVELRSDLFVPGYAKPFSGSLSYFEYSRML